MLDRLARMQHYSLPTRLLDLTTNPLVALYFACKDAPTRRGEVIALTVKRRDVKYFDSDTASCLANLSHLQPAEKNRINLDVPRPTPSVISDAHRKKELEMPVNTG